MACSRGHSGSGGWGVGVPIAAHARRAPPNGHAFSPDNQPERRVNTSMAAANQEGSLDEVARSMTKGSVAQSPKLIPSMVNAVAGRAKSAGHTANPGPRRRRLAQTPALFVDAHNTLRRARGAARGLYNLHLRLLFDLQPTRSPL
uniref:Uncharacterized protein n=1 Tax=Mesocestoides corti TaxID=53468 RepID=A0A5K3ENJ0_MESCO